MSRTSALRKIDISSFEPEARRFKVYTRKDLDHIPRLIKLPKELRFEMSVVSAILPFRVNEYVIEELIDWDNIPADPIYPSGGSYTQRKGRILTETADFNYFPE